MVKRFPKVITYYFISPLHNLTQKLKDSITLYMMVQCCHLSQEARGRSYLVGGCRPHIPSLNAAMDISAAATWDTEKYGRMLRSMY